MRKLYHILMFIGSLFGWAATGYAQPNQFLEISYFDDVPGLSGVSILDILQDKVGYLWVATSNGLCRYDGYTFKAFRHVPGDSTSIGHNQVMHILEDTNGDLWLALGRNGVSHYNRATGRFRNYPFTHKLKPSTAPVVGLFLDKQDRLWAGVGNNGVVHLDTKTGDFRQYDLVTAENSPHWNKEDVPSLNTGYRFFQDEADNLWVSTTGDCYIFNPKTGASKPWRPGKKLPPDALYTDHAYSLFPEGNLLWVGGWGSALRRIDRSSGECRQFMFYPGKPLVYTNIVNDFIPKSTDEFWVGSQERGLGIFNKKTEQYFWFSEHPEQVVGGPVPVAIGEMATDKQGNNWTVADGKLMRFQMKDNRFRFNKVNTKKKADFIVSQLLEDREGRFLFVGTQYEDGLHIIDKGTGKEQVLKFWTAPYEGGPLLVMDLLQARDGTVWVLTHHTVLRYNTATRQLETPPQPPAYSEGKISNFYTNFAEDPSGNLWLGTAHLGLIRFNPRTGESKQFLPDENDPNTIATNVVGSVAVDGKGRVWYGSRNQTAYGYFLSDEKRFVYLDAEGKVTADRATLRMNTFFAAPDGDIWACTEQGILHFDCSGDHPRLRKKYTVADGLPSNYVIHGVEDKLGNFWALTHKLVRIDKRTGKITSFGKKDGYDFLSHRLHVGQNGDLNIRMNNGYVSFNPDEITAELNPVPIALTSFKIDGAERYEGSDISPAGRLVVPADSRYFSFEFAALDLTRAEEREYEYRLQDFDNKWVKCQENRFVNFTNIPAGRYKFQVKPADGADSEALSVPLLVHVAFYKTSWFWGLVLLGLLAVAFSYFRNRQRQKQQVAELLGKAQLLEKEKAIVQYESLKQQLNPHFLFNSLTSLGSLISIAPKEAAIFLDSLSKTYRYILKSSERETVPLVEELRFGETFVKLQKTRFGEGLQVKFNVGEEDFHWKIVPVTLQNLIENAIKHNIIDEDEPLVVDVTVEDGYLVVRNNLQKKKFVETSNKRGLSNLQSFYRYLSDKPIVVVEDEQFFTIKIPLI
ncbi:MAG: histidine kinase [Lewinellaceae bacterium]|nr:histidine kinase [Lewinellaceae bacterium]